MGDSTANWGNKVLHYTSARRMSRKNQPRVLGLDIAKMSVVGCLLTEQPSKKRYLTPTYVVHTYQANPDKKKKSSIAVKAEQKVLGMSDLLALKPTVAVLEPTGVNYSKLWIHHLKLAGVEVLLVGHDKLRRYRNTEDKDDAGDAYALASYYFENYHDPSAWLRKRHPIALELREIALRLNHVNRLQNPAINRLRQDLAWQFPEAYSKSIEANLFWGWLAGLRSSNRYDEELKHSIGLGISPFTRMEAQNGAENLGDGRKVALCG